MTNYQSAIKRIKQADTIEKLKRLEKSFDRIYSAGFLTVSELTRLDWKLCDKKDRINARAELLTWLKNSGPWYSVKL